MQILLRESPVKEFIDTAKIVAVRSGINSSREPMSSVYCYTGHQQKFRKQIPPGFHLPNGQKIFDVLKALPEYVVFRDHRRFDDPDQWTWAFNVSPDKLITAGLNDQFSMGDQKGKLLPVQFVYSGGGLPFHVFLTPSEIGPVFEEIERKQEALRNTASEQQQDDARLWAQFTRRNDKGHGR